MVKKRSYIIILCVIVVFLLSVISIVLGFNKFDMQKAYGYDTSNDVSQSIIHNQINPTIEEGYYRLSTEASYSRVLDVAGSKHEKETPINLYKLVKKSNSQIFKFELGNDNYYTITNKESGLALDVQAATAKAGARVQQYYPNGTLAQKWTIEAHGNGYYIKSALGNYVLDILGANDFDGNTIDIYYPNSSTAQIWHFTPEGEDIKFAETPIDDNEYIVSPICAPSRALDILGAQKTAYANAQIYEGNRTNAQVYKFVHDNNGYYTIYNKNSNMVVDVLGAQAINYANVQQYPSNNTLAQKWIAVKRPDGSFVFHSALKKNLVLDVLGALNFNNTNVDVYRYNGTKAQCWKLYNSDIIVNPGSRLIDDGWYNIKQTKSNLLLDVPAASRDINIPIQLYNQNNTTAQSFFFDWQGGEESTGFYKIYVGCADNLALTIKNGSLLPETDLISGSSNGDSALWAISQVDNKIYFQNKASGLYLSVMGVSSKSKVVGNIMDNASTFSMNKAIYFTEGIYTFTSCISDNAAIDVPSFSKAVNARLQIYYSNKSLAQKWRAVKQQDDTFCFQSLNSGLWLGADSSEYVCQKSSKEKWNIEISRGYFKLVHVKSNKVLDLHGASVSPHNSIDIYTDNDTNAQRWNLMRVNILDYSTNSIRPVANISKAIDIQSGLFQDEVPAQTYQFNNSGAQSFVIVNNSDGTVSFRCAKTKKCLDLKYGMTVPGQPIIQYEQNGSVPQRWYPDLTDDCKLIFRSSINRDFVMDAGACQDWSPLVVQKYSNKASQKFELVYSDYPEVNFSANCPYISQNPELPWGCESVALTQLLYGMGYDCGKTFIANCYISYSTWDFVYHFAGDPFNATGIGSTMPPCITNAGNGFLHDNGGTRFSFINGTGTSMWTLIDRAKAGYPSVVWTTIGFTPAVEKWGQVIDGYQVYRNLHAVCLCGYDAASDCVLVCDSLAGKVWRSRGLFEDIYNRAGQYSVYLD